MAHWFKKITENHLSTGICRAAADGAKYPLTHQRAEKAAEDGDKIMLQIDQNGETVELMSIFIMAIMGVAGVGKSTAVKHIALAEYMKGTRLIFIDTESEYKDLGLNLN